MKKKQWSKSKSLCVSRSKGQSYTPGQLWQATILFKIVAETSSKRFCFVLLYIPNGMSHDAILKTECALVKSLFAPFFLKKRNYIFKPQIKNIAIIVIG